MKILFVVTTLGLGGVQEHVRLLSKYLKGKGNDIWVAYGAPEDRAKSFRSIGVNLVPMGLKKPINPYADVRAFFALLRLMLRERFDVVHVHMTKAGILGRLAAKLAGVKVVIMTGHGWSGHLENYFNHIWAQRCFFLIEKVWGHWLTDGIILLTEEDLTAIKEKRMYPEKKLFMVPNGIDIAGLKRAATCENRRSLGLDENAFIIITVGRVCKVKAQWVFVKAAEKISRLRPETRFLLVGEGPDWMKIQQLIEECGIKDRFYMLGKRDDVPSLLSASDTFVLTSITEGMAMTLLEAMALGKPVIVTDIPGNRSLVRDGETGILIPTGNPEALAKTLEHLAKTPDLRNRLGENARKRVEEFFNYVTMGERTLEVYERLLKARNAL